MGNGAGCIAREQQIVGLFSAFRRTSDILCRCIIRKYIKYIERRETPKEGKIYMNRESWGKGGKQQQKERRAETAKMDAKEK